MINAFNFAATPHIHFGVGKRSELGAIAGSFGRRLLLVTGGASFDASPLCTQLLEQLTRTIHRKKCVAMLRTIDEGCVAGK